MLIGIIVILTIIIVILIYKLHQKTILDTSALTKLNTEVDIKNKELQTLQQNITKAQREYNEALNKQSDDIDEWANRQRYLRQQQLENEFNAQKSALDNRLEIITARTEADIAKVEQASKERIDEFEAAIESARQQADEAYAKYTTLLQPIQLLEKEKQDKLFYTIQLPDEYKEDIDYLLTNVTPFIKHPDIISKLVWSEYMKPYMYELINRVRLKDEPGIYKLTNIDSGKAYIGKSTNLKNRVVDHFKSAIGIKSIADQAVHHEILKTGFWNWTIEPIIYCTKDQLNELEKYYIDSFQTQTWGYNKRAGG